MVTIHTKNWRLQEDEKAYSVPFDKAGDFFSFEDKLLKENKQSERVTMKRDFESG